MPTTLQHNPTPKSRQARRARLSRTYLKAQAMAVRKPMGPCRSKMEFLLALKGTGGGLATIAQKLGVERHTVKRWLHRPDWVDMLPLWYSEVESVSDEARTTVREMMAQRLDYGVASRTSMWYLEKMEREAFGAEVKHIVSGGKDPIKTVNMNVGIPIESLDLPIEVRRLILEKLDEKEGAEKKRALEMEGSADSRVEESPPL